MLGLAGSAAKAGLTVKAATTRAVRVNMTIPEDELERIDEFATEHGYTRSGFEDYLKERIEISRLYSLVTGGVTVSDNDVRQSYQVSGTKVKFDYAVIATADLAKTINPSDSDLQAFFAPLS